MTYPEPAVGRFLADHFVPVKVLLHRLEDQPRFRAHGVVWTPTLLVLDRRGVVQYASPGYLPPALFVQALKIGLGRALLAWARPADAVAHLAEVADDRASPFAAEALYWLGAAWYLKTRRTADLHKAWGRLAEEHPGSSWVARIPPTQQDEEDG